MQPLHHLRQKIRPDRGQNPKPKPPRKGQGRSHRAPKIFNLGENALRAADKFLALGSRYGACAPALKKPNAKISLNLGNLRRKAGLADMQDFGGQTEPAETMNRDDIFKLPKARPHL
ncbi:hypothetical protein GCM10011452_35630 [Gemmobacter lanyuensis]|uniref:Uncharacterized protein n=1 Tax=Gemmobacter lanyuensis TaxID=1054497 RepID=A0A918MQE2_9RHOB|nr:hypothetical protein GCM10011452_35630 [Gemmobacter lanyuensis]